MSPRGRRRLSDVLTGLAASTFPRNREGDARAVRDCAREAVHAEGLRRLPREALSLAAAGMRTRAGLAMSEMRHAPWRDALAVLALPLAATLLLVWTFGFISRYDHWPLGEGWALLLGGSLLAVVGAALERGRLVAAGALAVFVAAASPYLGFGTEVAIADTPTFFHGWSVDIGAASLLPTLLLVAAGLSLPRRRQRPARAALGRLAAGLAPGVIAAVYLFPGPAREPTIRFLILTGPAAEDRAWAALSDAMDPGIEAAAADPRPRAPRGGRVHLANRSHPPGLGPRERSRARKRGLPARLGELPRPADSILGLWRAVLLGGRRRSLPARPDAHAPGGPGVALIAR